jgi:hypothetical protein
MSLVDREGGVAAIQAHGKKSDGSQNAEFGAHILGPACNRDSRAVGAAQGMRHHKRARYLRAGCVGKIQKWAIEPSKWLLIKYLTSRTKLNRT